MFRFKAVLLLVLMVCPLACCYGQLHFATVNGERGYAAMRGDFRLDLDNGIILVPAVGYYRTSDKEEDEPGATTKFALGIDYEVNDRLFLTIKGGYVPTRLGFQAVSYATEGKYTFCYRCGVFQNPYLKAHIGQARYHISSYIDGSPLPDSFSTTATDSFLEAGAELGRFFLQVRYDKVIKYSNKPQADIASNWTEIPFMTAIVQGFVRDIAAARLAYRTSWITPYAVYSRYKYLLGSDYTVSVAGGLALTWGATTFSGGVEIFEQNHRENRKTYFSLAASTKF